MFQRAHFSSQNIDCRNSCCWLPVPLWNYKHRVGYLFSRIGLPKLIRHWQGTAVPVSHWIEHHALHFASDALLCGTYITKALNFHLNCALKVVMQEVLIFAPCLHAEHISGQSVALLNQLCQFVPHQVVHDSFLFWTSVKFLAGEINLHRENKKHSNHNNNNNNTNNTSSNNNNNDDDDNKSHNHSKLTNKISISRPSPLHHPILARTG